MSPTEAKPSQPWLWSIQERQQRSGEHMLMADPPAPGAGCYSAGSAPSPHTVPQKGTPSSATLPPQREKTWHHCQRQPASLGQSVPSGAQILCQSHPRGLLCLSGAALSLPDAPPAFHPSLASI